MNHALLLISTCAFLAFAAPATASTSDWTETPGGRVRVIIEDNLSQSSTANEVRGALQIELRPGWKTYWRNPGDSGVPPQVSIENGAAQIAFPAPIRFGGEQDGGIGYKQPVSLPLTFKLQPGDTRLKGNVFLGVCEKICVPVLTEFDFPLSPVDKPSSATLATRTMIETAFDRLPMAANASFGVSRATHDNDQALFELALPDKTAPAELFVASDNVALSVPNPITISDGEQAFVAKISGKADNAIVDYTLVQNGKAVSGQVRLD